MALTRPRAYQIYDIDYKQAVRVVTTTNIVLAGSAPTTVDGVTLTANDRVLVTGQSVSSENGIYYVTTLGTGSNGTWSRSVDTNTTGELLGGTIVMVTEGTVYADTQWKLTTNDPITIGSTALTFVQNYSANSITAGTSNVVVTSNGAVTISSAGTSNVLTVNAGSISVTGNIYPTANVTYALGNTTNRFKDIWLSNSTIYLGNVALSADSTQLLVNGSNVVTSNSSSSISTTGNITGNYILGNGSQLTGIISGGTITFSNTAPVSARAGDVWIQANTAIQYVYFNDDTSNQWAEMEATQSFSGGGGAGTPGGANTQIQFNNSDSFGASANLTFNSSTNTLTTTTISATGNITGSYILGNGSQLTGVVSGLSWSIENSNITMTTNRGYFVDTSAGAKTMTLPSSAVIGDTVRINDLAGTFGTNNLTVARNGGNIQGVAQDLLVTVNQSSFGLVYSNSTYGWKLLEI